MARIEDEEMMAAVARLDCPSFTVLEVRRADEQLMRVRFRITAAPGTYAVRLPLPSSRLLKPWLSTIPEDATHAAELLAGFLQEEVDTGCASWGSTTLEGADRVFSLEPYGFRHGDAAEHRRSAKGSGPDGYWGWIDEQAASPDGEIDARLAAAPFTYPEVGGTARALPSGYRQVDVERRLGTGTATFALAAERLMTWEMHRRAGLLVATRSPVAAPGAVAVLGLLLGPWRIDAPVRVVEVVAGPAVQGFAYGTLPGHPESGEERFLVHHDPDDTVRATIRAFSRPARWFSRLGRPVSRRVQDRTTRRYLDALSRPADDSPRRG